METGQRYTVKVTNTQEINYKKLSIQVRPNGLSFCILDSNQQMIDWLETVNYSRDYNPVKILGEIQLFYQKEEQLRQDFGEVLILFSNQLYTLIPEEYFVAEEASTYLKFNTKILKTDIAAHDQLQQQNIVNTYIPYTNITNYFFDKYGEFEFKHSASVFIEAVLSRDSGEGISIYLNNYSGYFDIVAIKDNQLILANTYSYNTTEDFVYYLLFTAEQLKADPLEFRLFLLGEISEESELFTTAYHYVKNVQLFRPHLQVKGGDLTDESQRQYYLLLKSLGCE